MIAVFFRLLPIVLALYASYAGRERIVEIGYQARDIVLEYKASTRLKEIAKILRLELINTESSPDDLSEFLRENTQFSKDDPALDPWGNPFLLLEPWDGELTVASCGPDQACETEDDIELVVRDREGRFISDSDNLGKLEQKLKKLIGG